METTIAGIAYLNMLQQFLILQLDENEKGGRINFQPWRTLEKYASTSAPVPQIGGLVERRRPW
jgi:hypothetical protein